MNARKTLSLFLAIVFALTTFATPVFAASNSKDKQIKVNKYLSQLFLQPGNKGNNGNHGNKNDNKNKFKFSDSNEVEWATKAIEKLGIEGILSGNNGCYKPKDNVTQLEALAMILNYTGNKNTAAMYNSKTHPLYKGARSTWGMGYIFLAIEKKILLPEELKDFNPNAPAKRHEVAKYIVRALGKTAEAEKHMDADLDFNDASSIPEKSVGYVYVAADMGLMKGSNNVFQPMKTITRAEMAVILDNAGGATPIPDAVSKKTTFVSYNDSTDKLTVKQDGKTYTYTVLSNAPVYVDGKYSSLDALKEGDVLKLIFNTSKQVIFVEVTKFVDNGNATELGTQVSASAVDYDELPDAIQNVVDDLKDNENYRAYKYDGNIYLIAAMGEKNTGGYDINIAKVYKYKTSTNHYIINVKVETDSPSSSDSVTQAVTHPYDIVKISYFSGIDKVKFLDESNDKLYETTVSTQYDDEATTDLGDELSVTNVVYDDLPEVLQDKIDDLKDEENYKAFRYDSYIYLFAARGEKNTSGYDIDIKNVYKYKTSDGHYIINAITEIDNPSSTDVVSQANTFPYDLVKIKYFSGIDKVRFLDEDNDKLAETTVSQQYSEETVTGTIKSLNSGTRIVEVQTNNDGTTKYIISSGTPITVNDKESSFSDLEKSMKISLTISDSKVTAVDAEDNIETLSGTLTGISISSTKTITVKIGSSYKTYTLTSDTEILVNNSEKELGDLRIDSNVTVTLVNGILSQIKQ